MNIKTELTTQDFIEMEALEKRYYSDEFIADYREAHAWYQEMPFTTMAAEEGGRIVGFLELFPVSPKVFASLKEGRFNDKYLEKAEIVDFRRPCEEPLQLFLSCVVIDEAWRGTGALKMLLEAYAALYGKAAAEGIAIDKIITDNVTEEGERFSKRLGFERLTESDHGTVVYMQSFEHFMKVVGSL